MNDLKIASYQHKGSGRTHLGIPSEGYRKIATMERSVKYEDRKLAFEMVRRYNAHEELLAALKALVEYEDDAPPEGSKGAEVYAQARAVISKATT